MPKKIFLLFGHVIYLTVIFKKIKDYKRLTFKHKHSHNY